MAKYARGKKSYAISDISGLRVKYSKLKTTWDGLRVSPEDFEPKHPQLTPAKNVVDATALMDGRPDNDPENVVVYIGFTQDWTIDKRFLPPVGVPAFGGVGNNNFISLRNQTGVGGTAAVGSISLFITIDMEVTGLGATGGVASVTVQLEDIIGGVGGDGGAGTVNVNVLPAITGVGGDGGVGTVVSAEAFGWGRGAWNQGAWGDQEGSPFPSGAGGTGGVGTVAISADAIITETGVGGSGAVGNESIELDYSGFGSRQFGEGTWGN